MAPSKDAEAKGNIVSIESLPISGLSVSRSSYVPLGPTASCGGFPTVPVVWSADNFAGKAMLYILCRAYPYKKWGLNYNAFLFVDL